METGPEPGPEQPSFDDARPTLTTLDYAKPTVTAFDPTFRSAVYETFFSHDSPGPTGDSEPFHASPVGA